MTTTTTRFTPTGIADLLAEWDAIERSPAGPVGWEAWQQRRIGADLWALDIIAKLATAGEGVTV